MTREECDQFLEQLYAPLHERRRREQERQQQSAVETRNLTDAELARWSAYFEGQLEQQKEFILDVVAGALGETTAELTAKLREEITRTINSQQVDRTAQAANLLRLDLDAFRHEVRRVCSMADEGRAKGAKDDKDDNVVVMPDFLPRKREAS